MMTTFRTRLTKISQANGRIILANDYDINMHNGHGTDEDIEAKAIHSIEQLHPYICGVKINFHLLLPLDRQAIHRITETAHEFGLQTIADIKLNDIGNTNQVVMRNLQAMGFDAMIANPIMGLDSLKNLVADAHSDGCGVITLCHMSAPEARQSYDMQVKAGDQHSQGHKKIYELFLEWALEAGVDGIIAGATYPDIIRYCSTQAGDRLDIFSPGIGTQGGNADKTVAAGSDYLIVGRTIIGAKDPVGVAEKLSRKNTPE